MVGVFAFRENALTLDDGGDESGFREAVVVQTGEQQSGKARFEGMLAISRPISVREPSA